MNQLNIISSISSLILITIISLVFVLLGISYSKKYRDSNSIIKIIKPNKAIHLTFLLLCCDRNKIIIIPRIKNIVCRLINRKFWLTEKDNNTPNNPRIKINIKFNLSIEFQKFFIIIYIVV